jgi:hypothetical protein
MTTIDEPRTDLAATALARSAVLLDRIATVGHLTAEVLQAQSGLEADDRDDQLINLALDVRQALCLPAPGGRPVPVVPGRSS